MNQIPDKIVVVVRKRPLSYKEMQKKEEDIINVNNNQVIVKENKYKVDLTKYIDEHQFNFDLAFNQNTTNEDLYNKAVKPLVKAAFQRSKVTCFAYGQTGSGKTYTMIGDMEQQVCGMYLLAGRDIFCQLEKGEYTHLQAYVSFFEIYCGKLFDLSNQRNQLQLREDAKGNVNLVGLTERKVGSVHQLMQLIQQGQSIRITSQNSSNFESSRSHAILQIMLKSGKSIHGKLSFIDLAGSERGADVQDYNKQTRIDGAEINKSLLALKECIRALDMNKNHMPFRGSKLTLVLKDSLMGNCKTVMIGNISPNSSSCEQTLNTLRYADRVKEFKKDHQQYQNIGQQNYSDIFKYKENELYQPILKNELSRQQSKQSKENIRKNIEDKDNNLITNTYFQMGKRSSLQPLQTITLNNNSQGSFSQFNKKDSISAIEKFNLSSLPTINGGNTMHINLSLRLNNHQRMNSACSVNECDNSQENRVFKTINPLFSINSCRQNRYNDLFNYQQEQDNEDLEEEQGFTQLNQQTIQSLENNNINNINQQIPIQLHSTNNSNLIFDHKQVIDKIIEITKNEVNEITQLEETNNLQNYLQTVASHLQSKVELIQQFQQKITELQSVSQHWTFQPSQPTECDECYN